MTAHVEMEAAIGEAGRIVDGATFEFRDRVARYHLAERLHGIICAGLAACGHGDALGGDFELITFAAFSGDFLLHIGRIETGGQSVDTFG